MFMQRIVFWSVFCWLSMGLVAPAFAAPTQSAKSIEAARVTAVTAGAFVERGTVRTPLKVKDILYKDDNISTDAKGAVELLFTDNTTIALAPDSAVTIDDFSFGGKTKANFAMGLFRGVARVVTGQVVKQNPDGFNIETPQGTVGIRGTILTTDVRDPAKTVVILTQMDDGHYVGVFNAVTKQDTHLTKVGLSCEVTASGNVMRPSTPAEVQIAKGVKP